MRIKDLSFYQRKAAMADLIERVGGPTRAGQLLTVTQQLMSRVKDRDDPTMLTLDGKLALELECGEPVVTRVEAELLGFRLEPIARPVAEPDGTPFDAHAAVMAEVADLCRSFSRSVADGKYSRTDAVTVGRDLAELRRSIERFDRVHAAILAGVSA
ncbi:hypothetical protein [Bosea lathyri]|uniref:Phage regulatory protein CII (CP76) n=1 Tax=Bosea lathyri TaxID=1036778 RepID=A0A1H6BE79_9HYPH|nr:hypothetical protein [Bosea lathyri]SEG58962.1 hypothetical protein SAMN04488115_107166 [Bosea lathyri]